MTLTTCVLVRSTAVTVAPTLADTLTVRPKSLGTFP